MPNIAEAEYQDRLDRLRAEVAKEGVDRFLVTSFDSIYYLTGAGFEPLERPFFLIVPPPGTSLGGVYWNVGWWLTLWNAAVMPQLQPGLWTPFRDRQALARDHQSHQHR